MPGGEKFMKTLDDVVTVIAGLSVLLLEPKRGLFFPGAAVNALCQRFPSLYWRLIPLSRFAFS